MSSLYQTITDDLKALGYDFRINDLDETLEVKTNGKWERITDTLEAVIKTDLRGVGYSGKKKPSLSAAKDAWVKLAHTQRYNPIKEYFLGLEGKYEPDDAKQPYIIEGFASMWFDNPDKWFGRWLFRWMVGVIAKVFEQQRNPMLVWTGEQEVGKSELARWFCPLDPELYHTEQPINTENKDHRLLLTNKLLWEVPELGATTRRQDVEALKAFITTKVVTERPPYGRHPIHKPAVCALIGSVNDDGAGFLNDPTGSSRFLACELAGIDYRYVVQSVHDLWAEAYWFYRNVPKSWELPEEEREARRVINSSFEMVSALEETILTRFAFTGDETDTLTTDQIKDHLAGHYTIRNENGFLRELSRIMKKHRAKKYREKYIPGQPHKRGFSGIKRHSLGEKEPPPPEQPSPQPTQGEF